MPSDSSISNSERHRSARESGKFAARALVGFALSGVIWTLCTAVFLRGETDGAYLKIASPAKSSLILGTSRAAQGLYPGAFPSDNEWFQGDIYNFAFTSATSPWGPTYLRAIEMKLAPPNGKPGLFVVEVSPLAFTVDPEEGLREEKSFLAKLRSVTMSPNPEYPFYAADRGPDILEGLMQMAMGRVRQRLHADGWLEITLANRESRYRTRLAEKRLQNESSLRSTVESSVRWEYFQRTLAMLQARGHVGVVRLPVAPEILALEQQRYPDFNERIGTIARANGSFFVDLTDLSHQVSTTDGSHLAKESAPVVTAELIARLSHHLPHLRQSPAPASDQTLKQLP